MVGASENDPSIVNIPISGGSKLEANELTAQRPPIKREPDPTPPSCQGNFQTDGNIRQLLEVMEQKKQELQALADAIGYGGRDVAAVPGIQYSDMPTSAQYGLQMSASTAARTFKHEETANRFDPPKIVDKNANRRKQYGKKKEDERTKAASIQKEEQLRQKGVQELLSLVNKAAKKNNKIAMKYNGIEQVLVKKHSMDKGYLEALVQIQGQGEVWMAVSSFWWPQNAKAYLTPWQLYCTRNALSNSWRNLGPTPGSEDRKLPGTVANIDTVHPTQSSDVGPEEAECVGHALNKKGRVFMTLKWLDGKEEDSNHEVRGVMSCQWERSKFSATWFRYCEKHGY